MSTTATEPEGVVEAPAKPVPVVDEASRPFFQGALEEKLMLLRSAPMFGPVNACGGQLAVSPVEPTPFMF